MTFRPAASRVRRSIASIALFALVLAQTLGLVHGVVHSPLALAHASGVSGGSSVGGAEPASVVLKDLFAGHVGDRACQLYDHSSHADLHGVVVLDLERPVFEPAPACAPVGRPAATPVVAFLARGPPA